MRKTPKFLKYIFKVLILFLCCFTYINSSFGDVLSVSTQAINTNSLEITYIFDFNQGSPNSIIAIEKPQDSIFISAIDSNSNSMTPSIIGDFYRFELVERDIDNFTIIFSSSNTYLEIFRTGEQILFVNSNIKLEKINLDFDVIKNFDDIIEIFPRNYEYLEEENRILITQLGALEDNMFRIRYRVENDSSISTWIIVLLTIPIIFFIALYFVIKIKPVNKEKKLDEFINKNSNEESTEDNNSSKKDSNLNSNNNNDDSDNNNDDNTSIKSVKSQDLENATKKNEDEIQIQLDPKIIYTFDEKLRTDNTNNEQDVSSDISNNQESPTSIQNNEINSISDKERLEQYIQKYFTENEQDVIRVINNQEGIMQQEILDNLPIFTKSTLSKIITKLEGKKMIERVRVGKVNKLFLGPELKKLVLKENN